MDPERCAPAATNPRQSIKRRIEGHVPPLVPAISTSGEGSSLTTDFVLLSMGVDVEPISVLQ